jgi:hypothetical protein
MADDAGISSSEEGLVDGGKIKVEAVPGQDAHQARAAENLAVDEDAIAIEYDEFVVFHRPSTSSMPGQCYSWPLRLNRCSKVEQSLNLKH